MYPCVPPHVTEHTEAAPTALESAGKRYPYPRSNSEKLHGHESTHVSLLYDCSNGSSSRIQDKRRMGDAAICIP